MKKQKAIDAINNIIENGFVICEEDGTEWLWDGEDLFVYMDENGNWEDWPVGEDGIKETQMQTPDDVGGMNEVLVRYCKNQDCGNPFSESDLQLMEVSDGQFVIVCA